MTTFVSDFSNYTGSMTPKGHESLHIVFEDVFNVGDLRNVHCLVGERGNYRVKRQKNNGKDTAYWKAFYYLTESLLKPVDILDTDEYMSKVTTLHISIVQMKSDIEELGNLFYFILFSPL
jgi:hypothetical protein